jgi:hypothetical protein
MTLSDQKQAQGLNEGAFTHAGHTTQTQPKCTTGVGQHGREQVVSPCSMIGPGGFQQGDGLGHAATLNHRIPLQQARQNRLGLGV